MDNLAPDGLPGSVVDGRYAVRSRIAVGGMSTVFLATDLRLDRDVALKILHPHLAHDENFLDRLGREAKSAAKLSHPHVVGMLDQGNDGSTAYLVMEYIKGHTLRDVLNDKGALPTRLALALIDPVIEGLAAAHDAGLLHRDVKPENVLIADDGRIKIGDFGLSRAVTSSTGTGALLGTVAYLSPELVLAQPADARSDIYSAGIMLYEMITGQQPFHGDMPIQIAYQHVNDDVPLPSAMVPGLAEEIDELVQWCTARDPENRPVNGAALLSELRHIRTNLVDADLDVQPPAAKPSTPKTPRLPQQPAKRPTSLSSQETESLQLPTHQDQTAVFARGTMSATEAITEPDASGGHTQGFQPTEVVSRAQNSTSVFPDGLPVGGNQHRPPGLPSQQAEHIYGARQPHVAHDHPPLSQRAQRKLGRDAERARSRAAATPAKSLRGGHPRRRGIIWVVVLILAAVLATGAGWFFGLGPGSPGIIPTVANQSSTDASRTLSDAGFRFAAEEVFDDDVADGTVVGTAPAAGEEIRKFELISLLVSKGPQLFPLPTLTGRTFEEAKSELNTAAMALGPVTEVFSETVPAGEVTAQSPAADTAVKRGTPVELTVSKGREPIAVPDVRGQSEAAAIRAVKAAGLSATVGNTVNDRTIPKGSVVSQTPPSGTLNRGDSIVLTISAGPKLIEVPSFVGKQATDAKKALEDLGFTVQQNNILGGFFGTVRAQDPVGTAVPEGSVVTITVV